MGPESSSPEGSSSRHKRLLLLCILQTYLGKLWCHICQCIGLCQVYLLFYRYLFLLFFISPRNFTTFMQTQFRYAGMPESRTRISVVMPNSSGPVVVQIAVGVEDLVWIRVSIWIWLWMVVWDEVRVGVRVRIHVRGHVDVKVKVQLSGSRSRYIIRY